MSRTGEKETIEINRSALNFVFSFFCLVEKEDSERRRRERKERVTERGIAARVIYIYRVIALFIQLFTDATRASEGERLRNPRICNVATK